MALRGGPPRAPTSRSVPPTSSRTFIVTLPAPMFLSADGGDINFARMAALETVHAYRANAMRTCRRSRIAAWTRGTGIAHPGLSRGHDGNGWFIASNRLDWSRNSPTDIGLTGCSSMLRKFVPVLIWCLFVSNAAAATLEGVTLPDSYPVDEQPLVLNGIGLRTLTIFNIRIYVAGLYLPRPNHDAQQILASPGPKVILLKFVRAGSKERVEKQYRSGEEQNCGNGGCDPSDKEDFERLVAAAPAVNPGDTSTFVFTENHVRVLANDRVIGDFTNRDLAYHLLAGFIGDHPPSQELRRQLLGLPGG
jgi:hypothetical protein